MRQRVAIIGSRGRLGKEMVAQLYTDKVPFDIIEVPRKILDVRISDDILKTLNGIKPNIVINCSAFNGLEACENDKDQAEEVNADAPHIMALWCAANDALLIHFSTDYASCGSAGDSMENYSWESVGFYGASKREGEALVKSCRCKYVILRISSLYGPDLAGSLSPLKDFDPEIEKKVIRQIAAPISTRLVAKKTIAIIKIIHLLNPTLGDDHFGLFNLANKGAVRKLDFAQTAAILVHSQPGNIIEAEDLPIPRPRRSVLTTKKLTETFGIQPDLVYDDLKASLAAWGLLRCSTA